MKKLLALFLFSMLSSSAFGKKVTLKNNTMKTWTCRVYEAEYNRYEDKINITNNEPVAMQRLMPGGSLKASVRTPYSVIQCRKDRDRRRASKEATVDKRTTVITLRKDLELDRNKTVNIEYNNEVKEVNDEYICGDPISSKPEHEREVGAGNTCFYIEEELNLRM